MAQNAAEISALGKELFKRIADMGDHFNKVGLNLGRAVEAYNSAVGSLASPLYQVFPGGVRWQQADPLAELAQPSLALVAARRPP